MHTQIHELASRRSIKWTSVGLLAFWIAYGNLASQVGAPQSGEKQSESVFESVERDVSTEADLSGDRAFLYAPRPMPHDPADTQQGDCMNCHAPVDDIAKKWRAIRPFAHEHYSQCLQCHVARDRSVTELFGENEFVGLDATGKGSRAHDYAPPTVPHKVFMREDCMSCHGPTGYADYRVTHPERTQCMQCHVGEAAADYTRAMP